MIRLWLLKETWRTGCLEQGKSTVRGVQPALAVNSGPPGILYTMEEDLGRSLSSQSRLEQSLPLVPFCTHPHPSPSPANCFNKLVCLGYKDVHETSLQHGIEIQKPCA